MKLDNIKKILLLGLILLIIAGIVVIALKGLNVSLLLREHESVELFIGKDIDIDEFKGLCKEIFGNKKFIVRRLELFGDSVNIISDSITNEELENLVNKINEKYTQEYTTDTIKVTSIPNIRLRDIIRVYIKPVLISAVLILAYMLIRFRKMKAIKLIGKVLLIIVLTEAAVLSIIAITRIPVSATIINLMFAIALIELVIYHYKTEKNYKK